MDTSAFNKEFYSSQTASKLMWGLLFACTIVSLNLMIEQIGAFADETEMLALSLMSR